MSLAEYLDPLSYEIALWAAVLDDPDYPVNELGLVSEDVTTKLRTLAILGLLVEGDTNLFCHNLIRSGLTREIFLVRSLALHFEDFHHAISRSGGFFDGLAAGDFDLARRIANISPQDWMPDGEYEDDFCFTRFFHLFVLSSGPNTQQMAVLDRLEACVPKGKTARLDLCRAIYWRDQRKFDEAFEEFLDEYEKSIDEAKERGQMLDSHIIAERDVFVEALAVLKISESVGFITQQNYRFCPFLARQSMSLPLPEPFPG
jgi:hypothetical protein